MFIRKAHYREKLHLLGGIHRVSLHISVSERAGEDMLPVAIVSALEVISERAGKDGTRAAVVSMLDNDIVSTGCCARAEERLSVIIEC